MTGPRSLRATAILICIFAALIAVLSGLCSVFFIADSRGAYNDILLGISATIFVPFGLLVFAMYRHIKRGPNLLSEIIAMIMGILTILMFVYLTGDSMGSAISVAILFAIPGLLVVVWGLWSFAVRHKSKKNLSDPFT